MKHIKNYIWILLIIVQTISGAGAGLLLLSASKTGPEIINTNVGDISLEGLSPAEAEGIVSDYYKEQIKNGILTIEIDGTPFTISYSDIDVKVDIQKAIEALNNNIPKNSLEKLLSDSGEATELIPVFTYNSGKLLKKCEELFSHYEKESIAESYKVVDGVLVKTSGIPGIKVDYSYLEQKLKGMLFTENASLQLYSDSQEVFVKIAQDENKEPYTTIISIGSVSIDSKLIEMVGNYTSGLQGVIVDNGRELSLRSVLDFSKFTGDVEKDLLNRIATALYQAALPVAGINFTNRIPAKMPVSYSQPGLEAVIESEGSDLVMKNDTGKPLMVLIEVKEDLFKVYIASLDEIKTGTLSVEKKDEVPPTVITIVNRSLSPNETRVVSEGVPGYTVHVYRTIDGVVEELYQDKYQPISKTVESGEKPTTPSSK